MKRDRRKEIKRLNDNNNTNQGDNKNNSEDTLAVERYRKALVKKYRDSGKIARPDDLKRFIGVYVSDSGNPDRNYERNLKIICLYINNVKVNDIAKRSKLTEGTIYNILSRYQIRRLPTEKNDNYNKALKVIGRKIEEGKDIKEIAKELNIKEEKVNIFVNKFLSDLYSKKIQETEVESKNSEKSIVGEGTDAFNVPVGKEVEGGLSDKEKEVRIKNSAEENIKKAEEKRRQKEAEKLEVEKEKIYKKGTFGESGIIPDDVEDEEYEMIMKLVGKEEVSLTGTERKIMMYLRAALKYSAEEFDMTDYSKDQFLVPDYVLPIDIILMKDITERFNSLGESIESIAKYHRISPDLVSDVLNGEIKRDEFRKRFFKSLNDIIDAIKD